MLGTIVGYGDKMDLTEERDKIDRYVKSLSDKRELKIGAFYWVQPALDPDTESEWEVGIQPARYAGNDKWNSLGVEGESDWPMKYIGDEIAGDNT